MNITMSQDITLPLLSNIFGGKCNIKHSENMCTKNICDIRMLSKHLIEKFQKHYKMMDMKTSCY